MEMKNSNSELTFQTISIQMTPYAQFQKLQTRFIFLTNKKNQGFWQELHQKLNVYKFSTYHHT